MILRKPYAFLIKYFKLIHLFICVLMVFLISRTYKCLMFFKGYLKNSVLNVNSFEYVNIFIYLGLLLVIGLVIAMIVLMRKKDKPLKLYIFTTIVYVLLLGGFIYIESVIGSLDYNILDRKTISLSRDICRFMILFQGIFILPYVIRTLGFDIKKFDFKKDLEELDIEVTDSEEFELNSPIDARKVEKVGRRRLRELKYYYIENKIFIIIVSTVVGVIIGYNVVSTIINNINIKYKEQDVIKLDSYYDLTIDDSYIVTNKDNGRPISINDNTFVIVKFTIDSHYNRKLILDPNKFLLKIGNKTFTPNRNYYDYFKDYGVGYNGQKIYLDNKRTYILAYVIPEKYKKRSKLLEYNYRYDYSDGKEKMIKKLVKLKPEIIN